MTDRPILFSGPMVRALLAGTKTQTRRLFKGIEETTDGKFHLFNSGGGLLGVTLAEVSKYGPDYLPIQIDDRLYVREHWRTTYGLDWTVEGLDRPLKPREFVASETPVEYLADGERELGGKDRRAMHMPRWASRLTLIVTDVRVERLQDISEADAIAEGAELSRHPAMDGGVMVLTDVPGVTVSPGVWYRWLWDEINGKGAWKAKPWVAAYTFRVIKQNIDRIDREAA